MGNLGCREAALYPKLREKKYMEFLSPDLEANGGRCTLLSMKKIEPSFKELMVRRFQSYEFASTNDPISRYALREDRVSRGLNSPPTPRADTRKTWLFPK